MLYQHQSFTQSQESTERCPHHSCIELFGGAIVQDGATIELHLFLSSSAGKTDEIQMIPENLKESRPHRYPEWKVMSETARSIPIVALHNEGP
jgi:hypothetical protein